MYNYETILVVNPNMADDQIEVLIKKYSGILEEHSSKVDKVELWGKREFAHEVKGFKHGHYINIIHVASQEDAVKSLNGLLRIDENIIKFQTHRVGMPSRKIRLNKRLASVSEYAE